MTSDWVHDKVRSQFAFQAICWERSHIPEDVWRAGDATSNVVESVHSDVNREGVQCTLVGGVQKGQLFDSLKMNTLDVSHGDPFPSRFLISHWYITGHRGRRDTSIL